MGEQEQVHIAGRQSCFLPSAGDQNSGEEAQSRFCLQEKAWQSLILSPLVPCGWKRLYRGFPAEIQAWVSISHGSEVFHSLDKVRVPPDLR